MRSVFLLYLMMSGCVGANLIEWRSTGQRGGTVSYHGRNLRPETLADRRENALELAERWCGGPIAVAGERLEGFNEHFVDFDCAPDGGL